MRLLGEKSLGLFGFGKAIRTRCFFIVWPILIIVSTLVDRVITTNQDEIGEGLVNFYSCLFSDDDVRCPLLDDLDFSSIDEEDNIVLDKPFTKEEVLGVVKDMVGDKAPGPDGYSMAFFQRCWDIVKNDVLAGFSRVLHSWYF